MTKPLVCITVTAATTAELRRRRDEAVSADLVELRLDTVADPDAAGALADRRRPALVTCRPRREGGSFDGSEEERRRILADALARGAEFVDVEWRAGFDDLVNTEAGRRIVLSYHDFDRIPRDLDSTIAAMRATGVQVVKIAAQTRQLSDCVVLLDASRRAASRSSSGDLILLGMGPHGAPTRVLASRMQAPWTYAGALHAVGQLSARELIDEYRFRSIGPGTQVYGITGGSVAHSVSPSMHNAALAALRLDAVYLPLPAVSADDFVAFGKAFGIAGASVTIPHKVTMFDRVDEVYAAARRIGAINTVKVEAERWIGDNTDAAAFLKPLHERLHVHGQRASVLGAGGAARAVVDALASSDCAVRVHARRRTEAEALAAFTSAEIGPWPPEPGSWDLLINCTSVGQAPHTDDTPLPASHLTGQCVYDLVYNPPTTRLLREAAQVGCQTIGGLDMLVAQAHEQFRWWTGARAPAGIMREAALRRLAEFARDENHVV